MNILHFFKKLFKFIAHITNTKKIISDIGNYKICANDEQSEKIRLWFKKILDIIYPWSENNKQHEYDGDSETKMLNKVKKMYANAIQKDPLPEWYPNTIGE